MAKQNSSGSNYKSGPGWLMLPFVEARGERLIQEGLDHLASQLHRLSLVQVGSIYSNTHPAGVKRVYCKYLFAKSHNLCIIDA